MKELGLIFLDEDITVLDLIIPKGTACWIEKDSDDLEDIIKIVGHQINKSYAESWKIIEIVGEQELSKELRESYTNER